MKKHLLLSLIMGMCTVGLKAQTQYTILEDLTASKIQNADFNADKPVEVTIRTYDYDMSDAGLGDGGTSRYGQQEITGWTAATPSTNTKVTNRTDGTNARAAGIFAYVNDELDEEAPGLGSDTYWAPYIEEGVSGQALGIVAVWGGGIKYTQEVTLPAGGYMIIIKTYNSSGASAANATNNGFIIDGGGTFMSSKLSFPVHAWENDTILFRLKSETKGQISLGYQSGNYGSGDAPHLFIDNVKLYSIDPTPLDKAEVDAAKAELLELIHAGEDLGVNVSSSYTVYNNPNATLEQVLEAIKNQKEINAAGATDLSEFFISNPHFSIDETIEDGITTYDYDMPDPNGSNSKKVTHYGMQPVTNWVASTPSDNIQHMASSSDTGNDAGMNARASGVFSIGSDAFLGGAAYLPPTKMSDGSTEGKVLGFVSVWSAKSQYTQGVTIPAGKYTLEISYYNAGGTGAVSKNLMGFIEEDGTEHLGTTTTFAVGQWIKETIKFTLDEPKSGEFTMGYTAANQGSGSMPHFFIDGISLYYVGETELDPSLFALQAAVSAGQTALDKHFYTELKEELRDAVTAGADLLSSQSSDKEANKVATDEINSLLVAVNTNINAYKKLDAFYNEGGALANALAKYETAIPALYDKLLLLNDDVMMVLEEYSWSTAEIEATIASLDEIILEGVKDAWESAIASGETLSHDLDISLLFDQLAYTYSTTAQSGANVPDKEWVYGDATNFKTQYGTAEVWNQSPFAVSRTIKDMPAGTYTITTKAFYRIADNVTNYDSYQNYDGKAYVFAGASKTELANVAEIASDTAPEGLGWAEVAASSTVYHPNSQQAAYNTFESDEYTETLQKSVATVIAGEKGDLTFGITADQLEDNAWVVWYTFSISYNAVDKDVLNGELAQLIETAQNYLADNSGDMNAYASSQLEGAITVAENAVGTDAETMGAAVVALQTAMNIAKTNIADMATLEEAKTALGEAIDTYGDTASKEGWAAYEAVADEAEDVDDLTNEELEKLTAKIYDVINALKVPASDDASDDTPTDFTQVIVNPDFEAVDDNGSAIVKKGWTWNVKGVSGTGDKATGINGTKSTEFWDNTPSTTYFKIAQTLSHLPAGTYELKATAVAAQVVEPTASEDDEEEVEIGYIALFATPAGGNIASTKVDIRENVGNPNGTNDDQKKWGTDDDILGDAKEYSVIFIVPEDDSNVEIGFQSVGTLTTKWFVCDDFKLWYYGKESSKTATGDDGELTDIDGIGTETNAIKAIYTVTGAKVSSLQKGINLVKMADGTVQKVLVK